MIGGYIHKVRSKYKISKKNHDFVPNQSWIVIFIYNASEDLSIFTAWLAWIVLHQ